MHIVAASPVGWQVLRVDAGYAVAVAFCVDEAVAVRVAALLDRHGMVDVALEDVRGL